MDKQKINPDKAFWESRYAEGNTGWDIGMVSPPLKGYIDQLGNRNTAILIPGCGNAYEAQYLLQKGFTDVSVIDIAADPLRRLEEKIPAASRAHLHTYCRNFFEHSGAYDLILEQTFFCALAPSLREEYARKMYSLLTDQGKIAGVLFGTHFDKAGPPFGGSADEYRGLFSHFFDIAVMEPCYNSHPKRAGNELFIILKKGPDEDHPRAGNKKP